MDKARTRIELELQQHLTVKEQKQPRVPTFPPNAEATAQRLREIIDAGDERFSMAYGALSRLCVLWAPSVSNANPKVVVDYTVKTGELSLAEENGAMVNDLMAMLMTLFPNGEGLPQREEL